MGRDSEDKAGRILSIYTRLKQGKVIYKQEESIRYGVAVRTIQRDITDMQCFLQEQASLFGEIQEIVYDKTAGGYILQTRKSNKLDEKDLLTVARALMESHATTKREWYQIVHKLIYLCGSDENLIWIECPNCGRLSKMINKDEQKKSVSKLKKRRNYLCQIQ